MLKILRSSHCCATKVFSITNGFWRPHFRYSTKPSSHDKTHSTIIVDYLIKALGFSRKQALSASSKIKVTTHFKSIDSLELVVKIFKDCGLEETQIKEILTVEPTILLRKPSKTLEPKLRVFKEFGFSGSELTRLIKKNRNVFTKGLETKIIPTLDFLRNLLGSNVKVIKAICNSDWLISCSKFRRLSGNVLMLQNYGLSNEEIAKYLCRHPLDFNLEPERFEGELHRVEEELGISRNSRMFVYGVHVMLWYNRSAIEKRLQVFRSFGWSDSEVSALLKAQPLCLTFSESVLFSKLNFLLKELGYLPTYFISYPTLLSCSLERRVKPRHKVLEILKEKKLVKGSMPLASAVTLPELKFLKFIKRFESETPGLYEIYTISRGASKVTGSQE